MPAIYFISNFIIIDRRVDYTETCTVLGLPTGFGGRPDGGKDPTCPSWRGITAHNNNNIDEYFRRVRAVLRTQLYGRKKILHINGFALPVLTYSFGVIHWRCTDLQQLDRRTRNLLSMHGVHHPAADVD